MEHKKIKLPAEAVYLLSIAVLALAVSMLTAADFGVSMVVAPAYIVSLKFTFLTFGQAEYLVQGILFLVFCALMKKVKAVYFSSFLTCLIYGGVLDGWRKFVPVFNPAITAPGSMEMPLRIAFFVVGVLLTALSVAAFYGVYLYPQVYDFFVKGISEGYRKNRSRFKWCYDAASFALSLLLSLLFFRGIRGIGIATVLMTFINGPLIGMCGKFLERHFDFVPVAKKFSTHFVISK